MDIMPGINFLLLAICSSCGQMLGHYNGRIIQLEKNIVLSSDESKKNRYLRDKLMAIVAEDIKQFLKEEKKRSVRLNFKQKQKSGGGRKITPSVIRKNAPPITQEDVRDFIKIDLHLIDTYFDHIGE